MKKILVVEDKEKHQKAAQIQLVEHDIIVMPTFDEAMDVLKGKSRFDNGGVEVPPVAVDALLTDLFYTQGRGECQRDRYLGKEEFAFGFPLAYIAALRGIPTAVVTDMNHHDHPMAYTFDHLQQGREAGGILVNGVPVMFFDQRDLSSMFLTKEGTCVDYDTIQEEVPEGQYVSDLIKERGMESVKNWGLALERLTGEE
ncbi:MAG: hypothetical protein QF486_01355 [Candidatus Woesearchaeota archaeon]|jgi:hypothetical protein|nr:hypothetical protein [Candidatus Woesearchaeota archaeon]MDP7181137.1 hypothetical protein [Candidatus Woesearchaeota archaeon]MDP7198242.1 hypothetical protein [Candidatus Woesearchaeota archaeon]MDP7467078.1 hypothetical protein [Candidatus Woesearchaeota archaeon]MDP7646746.1 hypothetical protein [Candidatus Woesearchaeota archaeon]|tara:strand:+ start:372 stop:968 length:597 start_codon:yes stop_codon:yes gene_type:complete